MAKYKMDMVLEYAKVFKENADMGSPDGSRAAQSIYQNGGQYVVNAYFIDEAQINQLVLEGLDLKPMNSERIIEGKSEYGIGKYMKLKRRIQDVKTFTDSKTGQPVSIDYGGEPKVVDVTQGLENKRMWNFENDGPLGNGTKAVVQFETYKSGVGVRLMNIGVIEHVKFETTTTTEVDEMFDDVPF